MVRLWDEKTLSTDSDWLIGEGCLKPGVKGVALRNMKFPGTAYDDPQVRLFAIPVSLTIIPFIHRP